MSCEQYLREARINPRLNRPPLKNPNEYIASPEDAMQIDLVTGLPPSVSFENIVTAMEAFSRSFFSYPTSNQDAKTIARVTINIMNKHTYIPTGLISQKVTAFTSQIINEEVGVLCITLKHATQSNLKQSGYLSDVTRQSNKH